MFGRRSILCTQLGNCPKLCTLWQQGHSIVGKSNNPGSQLFFCENNEEIQLLENLFHPIPIHPLIAFEHLSLYIPMHLNVVALNILLSDNIFAWHWKTVVDCMENIEKRQQWLILPKNFPRTQLWFNQNNGAEFKKFQWQRHLEAVYDIRSG